jgi:hypothetical protein
MGLYLYEEKCWKRTIYLIAVFLGWGAVIASNSDCAYAGMGMAVILLFFMALRKRKMARFLETLAAGALGYAFLSVIMRLSGQGADKLSGFNAFAKNTKAVIILFLFFVVLLAAYKLFKSMRKQELSDKAINIATVFFVVIFAVAAIGIVIYGRVSGLELFVFNDKWGTYRGYVWKRLLTIWRDFPIYNKIFGYGNESVRALMTSNYYDEMLMVTGTVYDNAHNEYLQYLVTLGIFGLVSFIGLLISAVAICIKHGKKSPVLYALLISICSYAAQAFFNVNQSITTPYLFLMISMAAGTVRYQKEDS